LNDAVAFVRTRKYKPNIPVRNHVAPPSNRIFAFSSVYYVTAIWMKLCRDVSRAEAAAGGKFGALKLICAAGIDWIEVNKILNGKFLRKCMHTKHCRWMHI